MKEKIMKVLKWIYANKISLTGVLALLLYILDEIFNIQNSLNISQEAYYGLITLFFIIIGYAIKGRGFENVQAYKEAITKKKLLKEGKTPTEIATILAGIIIDHEEKKLLEESEKKKTDTKDEI